MEVVFELQPLDKSPNASLLALETKAEKYSAEICLDNLDDFQKVLDAD